MEKTFDYESLSESPTFSAENLNNFSNKSSLVTIFSFKDENTFELNEVQVAQVTYNESVPVQSIEIECFNKVLYSSNSPSNFHAH